MSLKSTNALKRAVLDISGAYKNFEQFQNICARRNIPFPLSSAFRSDYDTLSRLKLAATGYKQQTKKLQKELLQVKKAQYKSKLSELTDRLSQLKNLDRQNSVTKSELEDSLFKQVANLPNLIDASVGENQLLCDYLNPLPNIDPLVDPIPNEKFDHKHIMEKHNLVNFTKATIISGRGWYYLLNEAAMLEQALIQYALSMARKNGFKMIIPPSIVKTEVTNACGFKPRDQNNETQVYELKSDDLCLTGTAEIPLAALYSNHEFKESDLPLNHVGVSRSYRAEAGAAGRDTRGIYRVHEFTKVELFSWTKGDVNSSMPVFDKIVNFQKEFISSLGLTARVLIMPANDLGNPAFKKIDIEVLMPGRGKWGEVSSTSNCLDFQSRRLNTRYKSQKSDWVHTLNGTACAIPRVVLAIIENNYDPVNDCIKIPKVLQKYMDDIEYIKN